MLWIINCAEKFLVLSALTSIFLPVWAAPGGLPAEIAAREAADALLQSQIDNIQLTPGPQGNQGVAGPQGNQGVAGPQGNQGVAGPQGDQGVAGPQGDQGVAGPQGDQGVAGPQGDQGVAGPQGDQGVAGPQGDQGVAGPQGDQGVAGPQGDQGVAGPQGDQGVAGPQGDQGVAGPQGDQGVAGPTGADGQPGLACWDLNGNGIGDLGFEDINGDLSFETLDCAGVGSVPMSANELYRGLVESATTTLDQEDIYIDSNSGSPTYVLLRAICSTLGAQGHSQATMRFFDSSSTQLLIFTACFMSGVSNSESATMRISHLVPIPEMTYRIHIEAGMIGTIVAPGNLSHNRGRIDIGILGRP